MPAPKLPIGKAIPFVIHALAVFGGVSGGVWLKSAPAAGADKPAHTDDHKAPDKKADSHGAPAHDAKPKDQHAAKEKKADQKKAAKDSHGGGGGHGASDSDSAGDTGFMKFSRQFVVPVITSSGVRSLVVMDINIEVPPGMEESIYTREPKLRDSILAAMLNLSNRGAFNQNLLDGRNLDSIRADLLSAARSVIGEDAQNVLILNITRQDV
ncbi:MAG: flagellar basal body-associated FliL family protein [Amphiplicatus sp.]